MTVELTKAENAGVAETPFPIIDVQNNGLGDVIMGCWMINSAKLAGHHLMMNPRKHSVVPSLLGIGPEHITNVEGKNWTQTAELGLRYEYRRQHESRSTRFDYWCESLGLPPLRPVRPTYVEKEEDGKWADEQWRKIPNSGVKKRVAIFPQAAWKFREWPLAYYIDLANRLRNNGCAVAAFGTDEKVIKHVPEFFWSGFSLPRVAAMVKRADIVIANDSGPPHLAGTLGTKAFVIFGPTDPWICFSHDQFVTPISLSKKELDCVACHFSSKKGWRPACNQGCQALMRLTPPEVYERIEREMDRSRTEAAPGNSM